MEADIDLRTPDLPQKLEELEIRKAGLKRQVAAPPEVRPALPSRLADPHRAKVSDVHEALRHPTDGMPALEAIRRRIDKVVRSPTPERQGLKIELFGESRRRSNWRLHPKAAENQSFLPIIARRYRVR